MNPVYFTLDKIKYATDPPTFKRALDLYESGKVAQVQDHTYTFSAIVQGTQPYQVLVNAKCYDIGNCTCYLGQNDILCKHMVALAIYLVKAGKPLTAQDKQIRDVPICSQKTGVLSEAKLKQTKKAITAAARHIKPYYGPSRTWFTYQNSLIEGCHRLSEIICSLPVSQQTSDLLVNFLLRLDHRLGYSGIDDSDGTVGNFTVAVVDVLIQFAQLDPSCLKSFSKLEDIETCFDWEEPLVNLLQPTK